MDSTDNSGNTALMYASRSGHLNIVKFLVDNDANIGVVNNDGNNALLIAVKNNNVNNYLISQVLI